MQSCLAQLLGAEIETVSGNVSRLDRLDFTLRPRPRRARQPDLLVVAARTDHLIRLANRPGWRRGFGRAAAWIIDNFWTDRVSARDGLQHFDHVFVTWGGNLQAFEQVRSTLDWLPWGCDALGLGSPGDPTRIIDVMRFGRQPLSWDDDAISSARCDRVGLRFAGRPEGDDQRASYLQLLSTHLVQAKAVLAHSNLADPSHYTHPTREYITARWVDAFACGCQVAGQPPASDPLYAQIDPGALLPIDPTAPDGGLEALQSGLADWTAARAARIHAMALATFDWRWRFRILANRMERRVPDLDADIAEIKIRLAAHSTRANVAATKAQ